MKVRDKTKENAEHEKTPCKCDTDVDKEACTKRDDNFDGSFSCIVKKSSACKDVKYVTFKDSTRVKKSARACEDKNEG